MAENWTTHPESPRSPGLSAIAYAYPSHTASLAELAAEGLIESTPELLGDLGFDRVRVATTESPYELALEAARTLLDEHDVDPESIGLLLYAGPQGPTAFVAAPTAELSSRSHRTLERFRLPGTRLQHDLGLLDAATVGLDQLACTTLFASVRIARAMCLAEGIDRVLCVSSEFFPVDAGRESIFNCTSDAAVAVLVERQGIRNRIISSSHVTKGYYWKADEMRDQIIASYFPTAKHVIAQTLERAGWSPSDVDWVIPHNVSERSWEILTGLAGISDTRLWTQNIARVGHTLAGDNFINLADALAAGAIEAGQRLLLFSYGFGAHWTALAVKA